MNVVLTILMLSSAFPGCNRVEPLPDGPTIEKSYVEDWQEGWLDIHQISTGRGNVAWMIMPDGTTMLVDMGDLGADNYQQEIMNPKPSASKSPAEWVARYMEHFSEPLEKGTKIDYIAGIESRGFIFGMPMAYKLNAGFVPIRKPNKLPAATYSQEYELEYGTDKIEIHKDAIPEGANVLIVDDLLATGGTADAACKLVKKTGANLVGIAFLIELTDLNGREKLKDCGDVVSMLKY